MKILVTGGSGFIGSHLVEKLINDGNTVAVLDLREPHRKDVEYYKANILSLDTIEQSMKNIDYVFHFAAASNIDLVKDNPLETIALNVMGTVNLLEKARKNNIKRFILASSVFVHDRNGHLYTTSKLCSELLCQDFYTLYSLPYTILRIGTAYGPRSRNADVISIFVQNALRNEPLTIHGDGKQKRNFIYVEDIASACIAVLNEKAMNRSFLIAGYETVSVKALADMILRIANKDISVIYKPGPGREDDYMGKVEDLYTIESELGWRPAYSLEIGIRAYMEWIRNILR